jgi:hypothetical protein
MTADSPVPGLSGVCVPCWACPGTAPASPGIVRAAFPRLAGSRWRTGHQEGRRDAPEDKAEEQAIALLQRVVAMSEADRDALPGSAVRHVKLAIAIMRKRRRQEAPGGRPSDPDDG